MAFFTKEKIDSIKKTAKDVKSAYDTTKEKHAEFKKHQQEVKSYKAEKHAKFEGKALQTVGIIPKGGEVTLRLNPDTEILSLQYSKDVNVTLPYQRILGVRLECVTEDIANNSTDLASAVLSSGLLGRGVVGTAGRIAGNMLKGIKKKNMVWIGTLVYRDKSGTPQEISFAGPDVELEPGDTPYKHTDDEKFEQILNAIALRSNQDLMEL